MRVYDRTMHSGASIAILSVLLGAATSASAQPFHLEDSLRGGTMGNAMGGSFGADGWTVTGAGDRIWYALPRLGSGFVEFTITNVTVDRLPLPDHEIFAMYEAGYGISEPIVYSPDYRNNHYKIMLRLYGMVEPGRVGAMKMMWGICPSGAPGFDACGCASFFEEPFADPGPWTGAPARIRVEWGGGRARVLRDGTEVVGVDWSGTGLIFGPNELHMMLGSPRNDGGLSAMVIGSVYSDLVVDGMIGPMAACPGSSTPDAGPPVDGGACGGGAAGAIADGTAASWEPGVFPDAGDLNVEGAPGGGPAAVVYVRFPPVAGPVTSATLTLQTTADNSGGSGQVCRVDGASWDEGSLTWASRPAVSTVCTGGARRVGASEVVTWDVTALVGPGGPVDLAIVSEDPDGTHYLSREAGGCESGPRLAVTLAPGADGGGPGGDGGGSPGSDGGGTRMDGGSFDRPDPEGGCGCATTPGAATPSVLVVLAALSLLLVRRRER